MLKKVILSLFVSTLLLSANDNVKVKNNESKIVKENIEINNLKKEIDLLNNKIKTLENSKSSNMNVNINDEVLLYLVSSLNDIKHKISSIENDVIEYKFEGNFDPSVYAKYKVVSSVLVETNEDNKVINVYTKNTEIIGKKSGNLLITSSGKVDLSKVVEIE